MGDMRHDWENYIVADCIVNFSPAKGLLQDLSHAGFLDGGLRRALPHDAVYMA